MPSTPITIKMPPAAAATPPVGVKPPSMFSTVGAGPMIMGEKGPIPAAPPLSIAPGLLPLVIKTPPAAPQAALTHVQRFPITGSGDVHERLATLEVHVKSLWTEIQSAIANINQQV